ncbi:hypothetical protein ABW16_17255 [Mycolicibacter heraklionensis]|uniref:O-acyltransferase WSD1 C-terminal domain-containing protein n=1 Tax=Mycolicibacter heraklionensis TaxID=512402 RepID=A0ABR5FC31_9MYCO|nr:WS/DGAT domain-containing protein [Mycolicibacter heraklionensis]KLO27064.1 hypothetical protein ABW16_17255 [Mycolicibacter heraklionensis]
MRQLSSVDAQFLAAEDGRNHGHISALGIYDPSSAPGGVLTRESLRRLVAQRIGMLGPFRWRLAPVPLYLAGARLEAQYPVSLIMDGVGLNITALSYRNKLDLGLVADHDLVADAWSLLQDVQAELTDLRGYVGAGGRKARP